MTHPPSTELLPRVRAIARRAGETILQFYGRDLAVEVKADASPVTAADRAADQLIVAALQELTPEIPVISEEAAVGSVPDIGGGRFWLVDPLDGTKEFINRRREFTVNIALIEDGRPVLGTIHAPALDATYAGAGAGTATAEVAGGGPRPVAARRAPADGLAVVASRSHANIPALESYLAGIRVESCKNLGSAIKFCLIASGEADLYPRLGRTMEWDTAAGHAVLEAAGGSVRTLTGAPLRYGKPGFENPHFVARGREA